MDLGLTDRVALVTASTSGLGLAIGRALSAEGATVALCGRRGERARELAAELPQAIGLEVDLTDPTSVDALVDQVTETLGPIDVLVLNSGGPPPGAAADLTVDDLRHAEGLLLHPMQSLLRHVVPGMRTRGWGRVLAIGSSGLEQPIPNLALSNAVRAALAGLLKTLATEVATDGITVNMLLPGRISTERVNQLDQARAEREGRTLAEVQSDSKTAIPAGRYGRPEEFAAAAAFLCSAPASYITGSRLRVDGGLVRSH